MKASIKVKVIADPTPPPPFVGTRIRIRLDDPQSLTWGMSELLLAEGHESAAVDWGDGNLQEITGGEITHTYAKPGEYDVLISDDIMSLSCSASSDTSVFHNVYAPMIRECCTNATELDRLAKNCFMEAVNLRTFSCEGSVLRELGGRAFGKSSSFLKRIDFPNVVSVGSNTFYSSTDLTELHFGLANEEVIKASSAWESSGHKFGAANATVYFDL